MKWTTCNNWTLPNEILNQKIRACSLTNFRRFRQCKSLVTPTPFPIWPLNITLDMFSMDHQLANVYKSPNFVLSGAYVIGRIRKPILRSSDENMWRMLTSRWAARFVGISISKDLQMQRRRNMNICCSTLKELQIRLPLLFWHSVCWLLTDAELVV